MLKIINGTMDQNWPHKVKKGREGGEKKREVLQFGWSILIRFLNNMLKY